MPGKKSGTGRPLMFQCAKCRRNKARAKPEEKEQYAHRGEAHRVILTGSRKKAHDDARNRSDTYTRQYLCKDCGHRGWSRHSDLARKERYESDRREREKRVRERDGVDEQG